MSRAEDAEGERQPLTASLIPVTRTVEDPPAIGDCSPSCGDAEAARDLRTVEDAEAPQPSARFSLCLGVALAAVTVACLAAFLFGLPEELKSFSEKLTGVAARRHGSLRGGDSEAEVHHEAPRFIRVTNGSCSSNGAMPILSLGLCNQAAHYLHLKDADAQPVPRDAIEGLDAQLIATMPHHCYQMTVTKPRARTTLWFDDHAPAHTPETVATVGDVSRHPICVSKHWEEEEREEAASGAAEAEHDVEAGDDGDDSESGEHRHGSHDAVP